MNVQKKNYDSAFCGSLPLHHLNVVQPHGVLMVLSREDMMVVQVSENVSLLLGITAPEMVNTPLSAYTLPDSYAQLQRRFQNTITAKIPVSMQLLYNGRALDALCITHTHPAYLILEIYPAAPVQGRTLNAFQRLKYVLAAIDTAGTVAQLCHTAARELKELSGFDKVLVYRFDPEWNGEVVAEVKEESMESYMGLKFPASDIPKQVRQMYVRNPYRLIPNRQYEPVRIYPVINPVTNAFVDLSDCDIRGVAAVHLEYMNNMQINASMSTRILQNDEKLWGIISCHHRASIQPDYETCSVFELVSTAISARLALLVQKEEFADHTRMQLLLTKIIQQVYTENNLVKGLLQKENTLLHLIDAGGVVICYNKAIDSAGTVPGRNQVKDLLLWLQSREQAGVYGQDCLPGVFETALDYAPIGSGILVVPINAARGDFIIFFRPEEVQQVKWGGNPDNAIQFEKNNITYHPRNSFQVWQQTVRYTSLPWKKAEKDAAAQLQFFLLEYLVKSLGYRQL